MNRVEFARRATRASALLAVAMMPLTWVSSVSSFVVAAAWCVFLFVLELVKYGRPDRDVFVLGLFVGMLFPQVCVEKVRDRGIPSCDERCAPLPGRSRSGHCLCVREVEQQFAPPDGRGR